MKRKQLPIKFPAIYGHPDHAYFQAIAATDEKNYKYWILNNFIQTHCNKYASDNIYFDFMHTYTICPFVDIQLVWNDIFSAYVNDINTYILHAIDLNYYVYLAVDEYYTAFSSAYKTNTFNHGILIYGYNIEDTCFNAMVYTDSGPKIDYKMPFKECSDAFYGFTSNPFNRNNMIIRLLKRKYPEYMFCIETVTTQLHDYLNSTDSSMFNEYFESHHKEPRVYGLKVNETLIKCLRTRSPEDDSEITIRDFHILWEHKKCMLERIQYLEQHNYINSELSVSYASIEKLSLIIRNSVVKYNLANKKGKSVSKIIDLMLELTDKESSVLNLLLTELS